MPWNIKKQGDQFCVFKKGTNEKVACHETRTKAVAQMRALYANEGKSFSEFDSLITVKGFSDLVADAPAGQPVWIQAFPYGHWPHPVYTDTTINHNRAERLVKNFKDNVRRQDIATDYNHGQDPAKGSKASGWVKDAELRDDGVYISVDFTPAARTEIANGEWKYFSAMMLDVWHDAETDETFEDVLIGGGLTNAPYMKGRVPLNFAEVLPLPVGSLGAEGASDKQHKPLTAESGLRFRSNADKSFDVSEDGGKTWRIAVKDEVTEWEHSEPGTGSPPTPRTDEDDKSGDKDGSGSRIDTPPIAVDYVDMGGDMKFSKEVLAALGLAEDADEAAINGAIIKVYSELGTAKTGLTTATTELTKLEEEIKPLRELKAKDDQAKTFAEMFPEQAKQLETLKLAEHDSKAKTFSEQFERIVVLDDDGKVKSRTSRGPSALVLDKMREAYKAFSAGNTEDGLKAFGETFEHLLSDKGIVEYGEKGSTRTADDETVVASDARDAAKKFAELVTAAITEAGGPSKMSWGDGVSKVEKENPALVAAYRGKPGQTVS